MKFGQDFHQHMLPEWGHHYVHYNLLKRLAKSLSAPGTQLATPGKFN